MLDSAALALDNAGMRHARVQLSQTLYRRGAHAARAMVVALVAWGLLWFVRSGDAARAAEDLPATRVIDRVPRTPQEVEAAHAKSAASCIQLPAGVPLAQARFVDMVATTSADADRSAGNSTAVAVLPEAAGRWPALAFGTSMTASDRAELPRLTRSAILDRIDNNYVSLQVRVERSSPTAAPYLRDQPLAGVGAYAQTERTEKFASLQQVAVNNVRSLGLFLKPNEPRTADNLRTLVLSTKGSRVVAGDNSNPPKLEPSLELLFLRLRVAPAAPNGVEPLDVEIHTFATTDDLKQLAYIVPYIVPKKLADCGLNSTIRLTEYSLGGQYPSARATRGLKFQTRGRFEIAALDDYARQAGLQGDALDNLTAVLDAIIDGRLKARPE